MSFLIIFDKKVINFLNIAGIMLPVCNFESFLAYFYTQAFLSLYIFFTNIIFNSRIIVTPWTHHTWLPLSKSQSFRPWHTASSSCRDGFVFTVVNGRLPTNQLTQGYIHPITLWVPKSTLHIMTPYKLSGSSPERSLWLGTRPWGF